MLTFAFSESEMFWEKAMVLSIIESVKSSFLVIQYFVSSFRFQVFSTRMKRVRLGESLVLVDFFNT
jgi:hypothetical protein